MAVCDIIGLPDVFITPSIHSTESVQDADMALQKFYDACASAGPDLCPIATSNSTDATVRKWANDLIDAAHAKRETYITPTWIRSELSTAARRPTRWQQSAQQLQTFHNDIHNVEGSSVVTRKRSTLHVDPLSLKKRQASADDSLAIFTSAQFAIWCGDAADETGVTTTAVLKDFIWVTRNISPIEGPLGLPYATAFCHLWESRAIERHYHQGSPGLANPVLIIGNTYDVITPLVSARKLVGRLNSVGTRQAALIQHDGSGHTSLEMNSVCTYNIIRSYFTDGVVSSA
ncbi:hypothetical protein FRC02_011930 [Tulasnella sp. 418]|nr:hypothetical protein FRC02_011930 [Tulasnella sp. 418]